jgi:hypothetical protein
MKDASAIGRGSKRKGKAFERRTAERIIELGGPSTLCRVPDSGAHYWPGDLWVPEDPDSLGWVVECKRREGVSLQNLLLGDRGQPPLSWFVETEAKAGEVKAQALLIWKLGSRGPVFWTWRTGYVNLACPCSLVVEFGLGIVLTVPEHAVLAWQRGPVLLKDGPEGRDAVDQERLVGHVSDGTGVESGQAGQGGPPPSSGGQGGGGGAPAVR